MSLAKHSSPDLVEVLVVEGSTEWALVGDHLTMAAVLVIISVGLQDTKLAGERGGGGGGGGGGRGEGVSVNDRPEMYDLPLAYYGLRY